MQCIHGVKAKLVLTSVLKAKIILRDGRFLLLLAKAPDTASASACTFGPI